MKNRNAIFTTILVAAAGCTVPKVKVTSDPTGAIAMRAAGGQATTNWANRNMPMSLIPERISGEMGRTPVTYNRAYRFEAAKVIWDDGVESDIQVTDTRGLSEVTFQFRKKTALHAISHTDLNDIDAGTKTVRSEPHTRTVALPPLTWTPNNVAVANLTAYTLSEGEVNSLTETLRSTIVETKYFKVLSRSDMKAIMDEQHFQRTDACDDAECLTELGKILPIQKIMGGSIGKVGSTFTISLRFVDVQTGVTEYSAERKLKADPDDLLDLIQDAGKEIALKYANAKKCE